MDPLKEDIAKLQEEYYQSNQKNVFFKKSQKNDCANMIASTIDKHTLFSNKFHFFLNYLMKYQKYVFCLKRVNIKLFLGLLQYLGVFRGTV